VACLQVLKLVHKFSPIDAFSSGRAIHWGELGLAFAQIVLPASAASSCRRARVVSAGGTGDGTRKRMKAPKHNLLSKAP